MEFFLNKQSNLRVLYFAITCFSVKGTVANKAENNANTDDLQCVSELKKNHMKFNHFQRVFN